MMKSQALVVGSVSYDVVFEVHNKLKDEVIVENGELKNISMMLTAKNKKIFYGGTGGNIAYGLGILGVNPLLFSVVGGDFEADYRQHLTNHNVNLKLVSKKDEFTATFYAISDANKEQIGIFQPNTHGDYMEKISLEDTISKSDFEEIKVAIFSPGTGISIRNHMKQFRRNAGNKPIVIFDPSQVLSIFFTKELLIECLEMTNIFIGNETEIAQLSTILKMNFEEIFEIGPKYIIETLGKEGSIIHTKSEDIEVKPEVVKNFVEQTGAGDAYRAGLIKGLLEDKSIEECCKIGSLVASKNVQTEGGQKYRMDN